MVFILWLDTEIVVLVTLDWGLDCPIVLENLPLKVGLKQEQQFSLE